MLHGQIAIASAALDPDAIGAFQSSRANTSIWPSAAPKRSPNMRAASRGCVGMVQRAFLLRDDLRGRRVEEVDVAARADEAFEQAQSERHARGARQCADVIVATPWLHSSRCRTSTWYR